MQTRLKNGLDRSVGFGATCTGLDFEMFGVKLEN